ncbi:MAG: RidA family protein [Alphaproteobacteria bacterium]
MTIISTDNAPAAIGPYVQATDFGQFIITSGQLPIEPISGDMPADIMAQTRQSLENIKAIIEAAKLQVKDIKKTTIFVKDLNDFNVVNEVYQIFFDSHDAPYPARSCVEVARLPKDAKVEIEAMALKP